jgi:hypothetical protein
VQEDFFSVAVLGGNFKQLQPVEVFFSNKEALAIGMECILGNVMEGAVLMGIIRLRGMERRSFVELRRCGLCDKLRSVGAD